MREHGVLRRALLVYTDIAARLRRSADDIDPALLRRTAQLFRRFGEDYHERQLEEAYVFPVIRKAGGPAAAYPEVLTQQHARGRQLTDFLIKLSGKGHLQGSQREVVATLLDRFVLMYAHHAAREDTVVFPAWKKMLSKAQLHDMGEKFEQIEQREFGKDGFDEAVAQINVIEQALGLADISRFTAPAPVTG
jgi:hemerythrin-like domain-containing protein